MVVLPEPGSPTTTEIVAGIVPPFLEIMLSINLPLFNKYLPKPNDNIYAQYLSSVSVKNIDKYNIVKNDGTLVDAAGINPSTNVTLPAIFWYATDYTDLDFKNTL